MLRRSVFSLLFISLVLSFSALSAGEKVEDPVCGFLVNPKEALRHEHEGVTYYFCDAGCKAYFLQHTEEMASGMAFDPVCGKTFDKASGVQSEMDGRMLHFCCDQCKEKYLADPATYEIYYDIVTDEIMPLKQMSYSIEFEGRTYRFGSEESRAKFAAEPAAYVYEACPIGGDVFLRKNAAGAREYKGKTYYFGCKGCLAKFDEDADKYMSQAGALECKKSCKDKESHEGCPLKKKSSI